MAEWQNDDELCELVLRELYTSVGALVDGYHRDTPRVLEQDFPVLSRGHCGQDSGPRMKVAAFTATGSCSHGD